MPATQPSPTALAICQGGPQISPAANTPGTLVSITLLVSMYFISFTEHVFTGDIKQAAKILHMGVKDTAFCFFAQDHYGDFFTGRVNGGL